MPVAPIIVSILILLEVILEDERATKWIEENRSFNPYFTGSNSGSQKGLVAVKLEKKFQSLFYWK